MLALVATSIGAPAARSQAPAPPPPPAADAGVDDVDAGPSDDDDDQPTAGVALPRPPADPAARDAWLAAEADKVIASAPSLARAQLGAIVVEVGTGRVVWSHHAEAALNLASVTKILTTATALRTLGPGFRWRTTVYGEKFDPDTGEVEGDLIVRGRGDPTFVQADLDDLVRQLRWRGVERVRGDLVFDGAYFDGVEEPPRFDDQPKERAGFRAPIGAASLERNAVTVVVTADRANLGLADVALDPPGGDYVRVVEAGVVTVASGRTRIAVATDVKRDHLELRVTGQIAADDGVSFVRRRVDDPVKLFGESLRLALDGAGIRVRGKGVKRLPVPAPGAPPPDDLAILAEHESRPLAEVIRDMVKNSDNYIAETVLKTAGAEARLAAGTPGPATWNDGLALVHRTLTDAGVAEGGFRVENGSGLFDSTAVPVSAVAKVLVAAWHDFRVGPELAGALAISGVDGTLRRRLGDPELRGRVRAKTGTLAAVTALAGYAATDSAHPLAFAVVVNALPPGTRGEARRVQDTIAALAVAYSAP